MKKIIDIINEEIIKLNSSNQNVDEGWGQNLAAGALMGAASLMPMKANAQTQNVPANNKPSIEMTQDSQKQVYAFMVGIATESISLAMQKSDIDGAGAFKEIALHYENLRDGKTTQPLSENAMSYLKNMVNIYKNLDKDTVDYFIKLGMNIHHK